VATSKPFAILYYFKEKPPLATGVVFCCKALFLIIWVFSYSGKLKNDTRNAPTQNTAALEISSENTPALLV
jgi:hypothetical protein